MGRGNPAASLTNSMGMTMSEPTNSRQEPTTIHWLTLPQGSARSRSLGNGNGGAALVTWRSGTYDTWQWLGVDHDISYLLGDKPPRYPVPATRLNTGPAWLDLWWARNIVLYRVDL